MGSGPLIEFFTLTGRKVFESTENEAHMPLGVDFGPLAQSALQRGCRRGLIDPGVYVAVRASLGGIDVRGLQVGDPGLRVAPEMKVSVISNG